MAKTQRTCVICDGYGPTLCVACARDLKKELATNLAEVFEVIQWTALRAQEVERKRHKALTDTALTHMGAALQMKNAIEELTQLRLTEKLERLDAALLVVRQLEDAET